MYGILRSPAINQRSASKLECSGAHPQPKPVLIIGFNRPDFLLDSIEQVATSWGREVYVAVDGVPTDRPGLDTRAIQACQEIAATHCDQAHVLLQSSNLGCRIGVETAIDWFFANVESGIILEDDITFSENFLTFCDEQLELLRESELIWAISGNNPLLDATSNNLDDVCLSSFTQIWGWATWRDRWEHHRQRLTQWGHELAKLEGRRPEWWAGRNSAFWERIHGELACEALDTWDYPFVWSQIISNKKSVIPIQSLTSNRGFDIRSTHTQELSRRNLSANFIHVPRPTRLDPCPHLDRWIAKHQFADGMRVRWKLRIYKVFRWIRAEMRVAPTARTHL